MQKDNGFNFNNVAEIKMYLHKKKMFNYFLNNYYASILLEKQKYFYNNGHMVFLCRKIAHSAILCKKTFLL